MCWFSMVVGVAFFLFTICVIMLAVYHPVDAAIGIAGIVVFIVSVNIVIIYYDRKWSFVIPAARLAELKQSALLND